ncbi:MAG: HAD family hydrolase, partial [Dehalococcoidia bacterium]|nr:HAD family hydrolase [Dehalococcoidia bacterium]
MRALIFDFDGLILDTETPTYQSWQELYARYGRTMALEDWLTCIGASWSLFDPRRDLLTKVGRPVDMDDALAWRVARKEELVAACRPLPGVVDLLEEATAAGVALAVASSSDRQWVDGHLTRLGLRRYFATTVCKEDAARVKPAPDLYQIALDRLTVASDDCVALEDSVNGARAAKAAGLTVVCVPNPMTRHMPFAEVADVVVPSLAGVRLADLAA